MTEHCYDVTPPGDLTNEGRERNGWALIQLAKRKEGHEHSVVGHMGRSYAMNPSASRETDILVVGAGPTGLVLALWLTKLGVRVRIIDKTAEPGTTSRAVAVQARTLEFYRQVGLADAVVEAGVQVAAANLWVGGASAARLPLGRMGEGLSPFPYALTYPQDAHERLLIERLGVLGVNVERRTELVRFDQRPEGVRGVLKRPDGSEEICE